MGYEKHIWERHPDEEAKAYKFFREYYLTLPKDKRTVSEAFRKRQIEELGVEPEKAARQVPPPVYHRWSNGLDGNGNAIRGLKSFDERAKAYDLYTSNELNMSVERRKPVLDQENRDGTRLLGAWDNIFTVFEEELQNAMMVRDEQGSSIPIDQMLMQVRSFIELREKISHIIRKSVHMTKDVQEDVVAKILAEEAETTVTIIAEELEMPKELDEIDFMSPEEFEKFIYSSANLDEYVAQKQKEATNEDD